MYKDCSDPIKAYCLNEIDRLILTSTCILRDVIQNLTGVVVGYAHSFNARLRAGVDIGI